MSQLNPAESLQQALEHYQAGRLGEAEALCHQVLAVDASQPFALQLLGLVAHRAGQLEAAENFMRQSLVLHPHWPEASNNLGLLLQARGKFEAAIEAFHAALRFRPDFVAAHNNLGNVFNGQGRLPEAIAAYLKALNYGGENADVLSNLSSALLEDHQWKECIAVSRRAVAAAPQSGAPYNKMGLALQALGCIDEAVVAYQKALSLQPYLPEAYNNLGNTYKDIGQLEQAAQFFRAALALQPNAPATHSNLVYMLHYLPESTAETIFKETRQWDQKFAEHLRSTWRPHDNDRSPRRRLRIGYVSSDIKEHVVIRYLEPLLAHHRHEEFEIFCYVEVMRPDVATHRLEKHADHWLFTCGMSDAALAQRIRADQIDILVDLNLHSAGHRLLAFAHKPAPVQASWLGYPSTTGLSAIDYRLTDALLDPPGWNEAFYSETSLRLRSFWCYDPGRHEPLVRPLPALKNGYVTFGSLNKFYKVNKEVLHLWARLLQQVEGSRLLMHCDEGAHRQRVLEIFSQAGVSAERVRLQGRCSFQKYLETYHEIDIGLDPFPYNGHTTSFDALWMGVPLVTLPGRTAVGRAGLMQLTHLGLTELIAGSRENYLEIAAGLAHDLPRLAELRRILRARLEASVLMDAPGFTRDMEEAYRTMWQKWTQSSP